MYYQYFGLTEAPFSIAVNPRYLFMSARHRDALAHLLYGVGAGGGFILLTGEVGTGKTTLVRGLIHALGYEGPVKSPTYTLVEPYALEGLTVYHFDFYRLSDPLELEYLGVQDYLQDQAVCLVEWPERANGFLPEADIKIAFHFEGDTREVNLVAQSEAGRRILFDIEADVKQ